MKFIGVWDENVKQHGEKQAAAREKSGSANKNASLCRGEACEDGNGISRGGGLAAARPGREHGGGCSAGG